jgi:purine-binding chemotaxis protein CheW
MSTNSAVELTGAKAPGSQQVLTFELGNETYGVEILRVREIRGWSPVTKIPHAPPHMLGVLNLRGSIVPIVDLRMRFALDRAEYTAVTVIIVLSVNSPGGKREVGVVVDGVSDVVDVNFSEVKPAPDMGSRLATEYIRGLTSVGDRMLVLLDIDRMIGAQLGNAADALSAGETTLVA